MAIFGKKNAAAVQEPMDLDAVMKKFDRESNTRVWEGKPKIAVTCILACFSLFCIYFKYIYSHGDCQAVLPVPHFFNLFP